MEIDEEIDLTAISTDEGRTAVFEKTYSINASGDEKNEVVFTLFDEKGNTATYNPMVAVKATFEGHNLKHSALFIKDLSVDMSKVVFGLPMLAERKLEASDKFTARFWSPASNTEIVFLSSRNAEDQVSYGVSNDNKYFIKSDNPKPIVLPEKGYYEISINLLEGLYEVKALGHQESLCTQMYLCYKEQWGGPYGELSQPDAANTPALWTLADFPCEAGMQFGFGIGGGEWLVANGDDTNPEMFYRKDDKPKYDPLYPQAGFDAHMPQGELGECTFVFDNFLMRAYAIQK